MDIERASPYLGNMASLMTVKEQRKAGRAARMVGGYSKLIEMQSERRKTTAAHGVRDSGQTRKSGGNTAADTAGSTHPSVA
ncbi:hypothetical protein D0Y83_00140 [Qipengyuania flava]|jgi:hypothetical protein|uniref:Uncharacterized protein n=1 Tax=Qipengyuania flava TaxID=192812 RepID=A0A5P6N7A2_9SPHN|nr:hypothetical protein D0Y83_00140 [Qipengyuania flava]|tara:strand:- start:594 stop:836 length:243 start_codon:yes stop_codon:yes gene_type:complete